MVQGRFRCLGHLYGTVWRLIFCPLTICQSFVVVLKIVRSFIFGRCSITNCCIVAFVLYLVTLISSEIIIIIIIIVLSRILCRLIVAMRLLATTRGGLKSRKKLVFILHNTQLNISARWITWCGHTRKALNLLEMRPKTLISPLRIHKKVCPVQSSFVQMSNVYWILLTNID